MKSRIVAYLAEMNDIRFTFWVKDRGGCTAGGGILQLFEMVEGTASHLDLVLPFVALSEQHTARQAQPRSPLSGYLLFYTIQPLNGIVSVGPGQTCA